MKIRFYLFDYFTFADVEWGNSVLPQKGDEIFINELLRFPEGCDVMKVLKIEDSYYYKKLVKTQKVTESDYWKLKKTFNLRITGNPIWRVIDNKLTLCYLLTEENITEVPDAKYELKDFDSY